MQETNASLDQLLHAKAELDARIEQIQREKKAQHISDIRKAMEQYGITLADLGNRRSRSDKGKARSGAGVPKYRDPVSGATWTGFGRRPAWIAGDKESYRIAA